MPLPKGTRYRVTRKGGKKIRLAFKQGTNKVLEAKELPKKRKRPAKPKKKRS